MGMIFDRRERSRARAVQHPHCALQGIPTKMQFAMRLKSRENAPREQARRSIPLRNLRLLRRVCYCFQHGLPSRRRCCQARKCNELTFIKSLLWNRRFKQLCDYHPLTFKYWHRVPSHTTQQTQTDFFTEPYSQGGSQREGNQSSFWVILQTA